MKRILLFLVAITSLSTFGQEIIGAQGPLKDFFEFKIIGKVSSERYWNDSIEFYSNKTKGHYSQIQCDKTLQRILYRNSDFINIPYSFSNLENCKLVLSCIEDLKKGEVISIRVNRKDKKITKVVVPASCRSDPWASEEDSQLSDLI